MPGIPFFQLLPGGRVRATAVDRPFVQFRKAATIMREGLRFECGAMADGGVRMMIVDRNNDRRKAKVLAEEIALVQMPFSTIAAVDRLIDGFFAKLAQPLEALN